MSGPGGDGLPYLAGWLEAQQALARLAASASSANPATAADPLFTDAYRRFFAMPQMLPATAAATPGGPAWQRYQAALQQFGILLGEAAADAGRRLAAALAESGPDAPPVTSLRELRELWIDCGESAWSAAARREAFAAGLAELLAAWAALRAAGQSA